jgi:anti-sigma regulatory factor (Ser/Thr protein kinase)
MNRTALDTTSRLPPALASAASARHLVRDALQTAGIDHWSTVDTAMLLVSEVVTNAVVHAHTPVELHIAVRDQVLRVEARDGSTTPPRRPHIETGATSGRGLAMIDELATSWGSVVDADGKTVWFELRDEPSEQPPVTRDPSLPATAEPVAHHADEIERGRRALGISSTQLWLDYLAVGGRASWVTLQDFLCGDDTLPPSELDRLTQALDDRRVTVEDLRSQVRDQTEA